MSTTTPRPSQGSSSQSSRSVPSLDDETLAIFTELPLTQIEEAARKDLGLSSQDLQGKHTAGALQESTEDMKPDVERIAGPSAGKGTKRERSVSPHLAPELHADGQTIKVSVPQDDTYAAIQFGDFSTYMRNKRQKLDVQHQAWRAAAETSAGKAGPRATSDIFAECVIHINGYTTPPSRELNELIVLHGGKVMVYLDSKRAITHIVASNLTPKKHGEFKAYKVVVPEWITDSIKAGKKLDWKEYRLGTEVVHTNHGPAGVESPFGEAVTQKNLKSFFSKPSAQVSDKKEAPMSASASNIDDKQAVLAPSARVKDEPTGEAAAPETPRKRRLLAANPAVTGSPFSSSQRAARLLASPGWRAAHASSDNVAPGVSKLDAAPDARGSMPPPDTRMAEAPQDVLDTFQEKSRLSHLSLWKAEMQDLVRTAATEANKRLDSMDLPTGVSRVIMHVDFDCFFANVGLLSHPELRETPVAICHGKTSSKTSSSEVASCNYLARASGVFNGMFLGEARKVCPGLNLLPYEFEKYHEISVKFYSLLLEHSDALEAVSIDEALIDVSLVLESMRDGTAEGSLFQRYKDRVGSQGDQWTPEKQLAECLRDEIRETTGCEASIGIGSNVLLARLATRKAKPAGSFHITTEDRAAFLDGLDIDDLHGWGYKTAAKINTKFGSTNVGAVKAKASLGKMQALLGPGNGKDLWDNMHGIALDRLRAPPPRNSIGATMNYAIRCPDEATARGFIRSLATSVSERMKVARCKAKHIRVTVMKRAEGAPIEPPKYMGHGKCDTYDRSSPISDASGGATDDLDRIFNVAWELVAALNIEPPELRGLSISMSKLDNAEPTTLLAPGQKSLDGFAVKRVKTSSKSGATDLPLPSIDGVPSPGQPAAAVQAPTRLQSMPPTRRAKLFDLPTVSQVDPSVLEELPESVRSEVLSDMRRRGGASKDDPGPSRVGLRSSVATSKPPVKSERATTISPASRKQQGQLHFPRAGTKRSSVTPGADSPLRGASPFSDGSSRSRASTRSPTKPVVNVADLNPSALTDATLRALGIEAEVFRVLSSRDQRDHILASALGDESFAERLPLKWRLVVDAQRASREVHKASIVVKRDTSVEAIGGAGGDGTSSTATDLAGPRTKQRTDISQAERRYRASLRKGTTTPLLSADRGRATSAVPPTLGRRTRASASTQTTATGTDDVRTMLGAWVRGGACAAPRAADVKRFRDFLCACLDDAPGGSFASPRNDPQRVARLLGAWRYLVRRQWPCEEGAGAGAGANEVGQAWWTSLREVEAEVQRVSRARFDGAELAIP